MSSSTALFIVTCFSLVVISSFSFLIFMWTLRELRKRDGMFEQLAKEIRVAAATREDDLRKVLDKRDEQVSLILNQQAAYAGKLIARAKLVGETALPLVRESDTQIHQNGHRSAGIMQS